MPLSANAIKLAKILDLDINKAEKLYDIASLSDLATLTTALNTDDINTIRDIYTQYEDKLRDLPPAKDVKEYYNQQEIELGDNQNALTTTADFFGIKAEDVELLLSDVAEESEPSDEDNYIPDEDIKDAANNINEMLKGGKSRNKVYENCKRPWQRSFLLGMIPPSVSKVIQKTIDMTPLAAMQSYAKIHQFGEPALKENSISLQEIIESILEFRLNNFDKIQENLNKKMEQELEDKEKEVEKDEKKEEKKDLDKKEDDKEIAKPNSPEDKLKGNVKILIDNIKKKKF